MNADFGPLFGLMVFLFFGFAFALPIAIYVGMRLEKTKLASFTQAVIVIFIPIIFLIIAFKLATYYIGGDA